MVAVVRTGSTLYNSYGAEFFSELFDLDTHGNRIILYFNAFKASPACWQQKSTRLLNSAGFSNFQ